MAKELVKAPESLSVWMSNMRELIVRQPKLGAVLHDYVEKHGHEFAHYETATPEGRWIEGLTPEPFFQPNAEPRFEWSKKSKTTPIFFQYGIGVPPYAFKAIRALPKEALSIMVIEPNIALLAYTLHMTNVFLAMPGNGILTFLTVPEGEDQRSVTTIQLREEALMNSVNIYGVYTMALLKASTHDSEIKAMKAIFDEIFGEIREWATIRLAMLGNSAEDTMLGLRQMAIMAPWISYGYQITSLLGPFMGRPFIVVSAGPSLDKNIDQLKDIRDKCVIVANDAVLKKMVDKGILPHIICSLERALPTYNFFFRDFVQEHREECSNILLICQTVCTPQIFGRWPGPKILVGKAEIPVDKWFVVSTLGGQAINAGSSVAHMCYSVAVAAGASSIALIGQDLAYSPDGQSHAGGVGASWSVGDKWGDPEKSTAPSENRVPAALGGEVITAPTWVMFLRALERMVAISPIPTYDCTEGGALIAGTTVLPLFEYIEDNVSELEPFEFTPLEVVVKAGMMQPKSERYGVLSRLFERAYSTLDEADGIIKEILALMDRASAPALTPDMRMPHAIGVGKLIDKLHDTNPMFAFVTQSYVYLSSVELAHTRFLDTVEAVERWKAMHDEVVGAHEAVLRFIRKWLDYAKSAIEYYADRDLPMLPPSPDEAMERLERISDELGDGHDQTALLMEMNAFLSSVDMVRWSWSGRILWQCANFLLEESRSEEATVMMKAAAADFEDTEMPTDDIVRFFKDYARALLTPDLCRVPEFSLAETILGNAIELGGMDDEIRELRRATFEGEISVYTDYEALSGRKGPGVRKWFMARAAAAEALAEGDALKAMEMIWFAICEHGALLPGWASSHLDWLATNMEKFFGVEDEPYKSSIENLLADMVAHASVISSFPIHYSPRFLEALSEHGLTIKYQYPQQEGKDTQDDKGTSEQVMTEEQNV